MSTAFDPNLIQTVDEDIPDQLPTGGYYWAGQIVSIGFIATPDFKKESGEKYGHKVNDRMFMVAWNPLEFKFDTNPDSLTFQRQGTLSVDYLNYIDKNGNTIGPNSPFGYLKGAFDKLGYKLRNKVDADALVGKKFRVFTGPKKYVGDSEVWTSIPTEELPADWTYTGLPKEPRKRGYESATAAERPVDEGEAISKLLPTLSGKEPKEFVMAVINAGLESPWVDWAATDNGERLILKMKANGMDFVNGKLVLNGSK